MVTYSAVAVGTDGSDSSLQAVRTAASLSHVYEAKLVIICAWYSNTGSLLSTPSSETSVLPVVSEDLADEYLAEARSVAESEGATLIETRKVPGAPANVLTTAVDDADIDLLVVGNKGINSLTGRLFGNIPTDVARRSTVDVMIVNTDDPRS